MFDIHCHIVFGCDDGSDSLETSVQMAELAAKNGTEGICATPHCNVPESYQNYMTDEFRQKLLSLRGEFRTRNIPVKLFFGQEIYCTPQTPKLLAQGKLITLNNSRYPLIEFGFFDYAETVYVRAKELVAQGYVPVIAHPERYRFVQESEESLLKLKNIGCLLQLNKGSLEGKFGREAYFVSQSILEQRLADVIASDAHSPYMRTTDMSRTHEMVSEEYSFEYADYLLTENPKKILMNSEITEF